MYVLSIIAKSSFNFGIIPKVVNHWLCKPSWKVKNIAKDFTHNEYWNFIKMNRTEKFEYRIWYVSQWWYLLFMILMIASSEYFISTWRKGSDARDPHCLVRWCTQRCHGGNGHDDYFELFMIVIWVVYDCYVAAVDGFHERDDVLDDDSMSRMLILPSCDQGGGKNQKT